MTGVARQSGSDVNVKPAASNARILRLRLCNPFLSLPQAKHALAGELPREIYAERGEGATVPPVRAGRLRWRMGWIALLGCRVVVAGGRNCCCDEHASLTPQMHCPGPLSLLPQVLLVAHPFANSLPSALEALARLQQVRPGLFGATYLLAG